MWPCRGPSLLNSWEGVCGAHTVAQSFRLSFQCSELSRLCTGKDTALSAWSALQPGRQPCVVWGEHSGRRGCEFMAVFTETYCPTGFHGGDCFLVYNSASLSVFSVLYNHRHHPAPESFPHPKLRPLSLGNTNAPVPSPPSLRQPPLHIWLHESHSSRHRL